MRKLAAAKVTTGRSAPRPDDDDLTAGALADCTLVRFPKTGHNIHWYDPAGTLSAVMGFLEGV